MKKSSYWIIHRTLFTFAATLLASASAELTIVNPSGGFLGSNKTQITTVHNGTEEQQVSYDATGMDKLVLTIGSEPGNNGQQLTNINVSYGGAPMTRAVFGNTRSLAGDCGGAAIFYLDNPTPGSATFSVSATTTSGGLNGGRVAILGLVGTAEGAGNTSASATTQASAGNVSTSLTTSAANSLVIAMVQNSGTNNSAGTPTVVAPLTLINNGFWGSQWGSTATGRQFVTAPGTTITPTFSTNAGSNIQIVAAEFFAPSSDIPTNPSPAYGIVVPGGNVQLSWTNLAPGTGSNVWVDVWFGSDPEALVKVVDAATDGPNRTTATVNAPLGNTWYWRVDSYVDGAPSGTPVTGTLFFFAVEDGDNDGLPDSYELAYTDPQSPTAMVPSEDDDIDGLTNLQEYQLGTIPNKPDTDGDTLLDGAELAGVGLRPATDPLKFDTDGDGLSDGAETNTGAWVSTADTGTDPSKTDSDADGLLDGVETNTGTFVDANNTGTSPLNPDSDGDHAGDWYEVLVSNTDPTDADDKPFVPYPLPPVDPGDFGTGNKPVKVFILSGQSNMVAFGRVDGTAKGTLQTISKVQNKFPNLVDHDTGEWAARNDVRYRGVLSALGNGPLAPGYGSTTNSFGPELGFGHVLGWYLDEPVLLIKAAVGGRALCWDFLPPGSVQFTPVGSTTTYAGYGDAPASWTSGGAPTPGPAAFYGGYQFDQSFKRFGDWHPTASAASVTNAATVLDNFAAEYPEWAKRGFEIAGFVWWQGWNDGLSYTTAYANRYEQNMVKFIKQIRAYYESIHPNKGAANAPFVLATAGFQGFTNPVANRATVVNAQLAVDGTAGKYEEFAGNVRTIDSRPFWRVATESPQNDESHYNHNAETYMIVGDLLGRAMVEMLDARVTPGGSYTIWATTNAPNTGNDPSADEDGDGVSNGVEFVLGGDKDTNDLDKLPIVATSGGNLTFTFVRDQESIDALVAVSNEVGTDLANWPDVYPVPDAAPGAVPVGVGDNGDGTDTVTLTVTRAPDAAKYARLKVVITP